MSNPSTRSPGRVYPKPEEFSAVDQNQLEQAKSAKAELAKLGINPPQELLEKIEQLSSETRFQIPEWVKDTKWNRPIRRLQVSLREAQRLLEGVVGAESTVASIKKQIKTIERFYEPKDYLHGMSRIQYANTFREALDSENGQGTSLRAYSETSEPTPEDLRECLEGLRSDFEHGIVLIDSKGDLVSFNEQIEKSIKSGKLCSAEKTWEIVKRRLLAKDGKLLKKAAKMQGKGQLVGVFKGLLFNNELCIIDRGDNKGGREPVIIAFDAHHNRITITTDTPDRDKVLREVKKYGRFADYSEILQAVKEDGYSLPQSSTKRNQKEGIVAAVEALDGKFVASQNLSERRIAILDNGRMWRDKIMQVVEFFPNTGKTEINHITIGPGQEYRTGVVRVLRG